MRFFKNKDKIIQELNAEINILKFRIQDLKRENLSFQEKLKEQSPLIKTLEKRLNEQGDFIDNYILNTVDDAKAMMKYKIKHDAVVRSQKAELMAEVKKEMGNKWIDEDDK